MGAGLEKEVGRRARGWKGYSVGKKQTTKLLINAVYE